MITKKNLFKICLFFIVCCLMLLIASVSQFMCAERACALENISYVINGSRTDSVNTTGIPIIVNTTDYYVGKYGNIANIEFTTTYDYYKLNVYLNNDSTTDYSNVNGIVETPGNDKVVFNLVNSGTFNVYFYGYNNQDDVEAAESVSFIVKSDKDAPIIPDLNGMSYWIKTGDQYNYEFNWASVSDALSGIYGLYYYMQYEDNSYSNIAIVDTNTTIQQIAIEEKCTLYIVAIDNCGNMSTKSVVLDKIDDTNPPEPTYTINPNPNTTLYSNTFIINVTNIADSQSGLKTNQYYYINGVKVDYTGTSTDIVLNEKTDYTIYLYSEDNAGNTTNKKIEFSSSHFDVTKPVIQNITHSFDISASIDNCYNISFTGYDYEESGIKYARLNEINKNFTKVTDTTYAQYSISFNPFELDHSTLLIVVEDNAGNSISTYTDIKYVLSATITNDVISALNDVTSIDSTKYTEDLMTEINNKVANVSSIFSMNNVSIEELKIAIKELDALVNTDFITSYSIISAPNYASSSITFSVDKSDFPGYKHGDTVLLELSDSEGPNKAYLSDVGFKDGFTDYFSLNIKYNGAALNNSLVKGLSITMSCPLEYAERDFALIDVKTGKQIDIEVINNQIKFNLTESKDLALCISGSMRASKAGNVEIETINVFGNKVAKKTFYLIVGISGGIAVLLIFGVIVIMVITKRRG